MNKEWSELNKQIQKQIGNRVTFDLGIQSLLLLRENLMKQVDFFEDSLSEEQLCAIPFINADGYHSKTIAYSIYHIARIEDIVAHSLIRDEKEIFFAEDYVNKMNSPIITTGNELVKQEIADFSKTLNLSQLFQYFRTVYEMDNIMLKQLDYDDMKRKFTQLDRIKIQDKKVVSESELANWLIEYWCSKDVRGLLKMPFSRHWIMHIEASLRIYEKVIKH